MPVAVREEKGENSLLMRAPGSKLQARSHKGCLRRVVVDSAYPDLNFVIILVRRLAVLPSDLSQHASSPFPTPWMGRAREEVVDDLAHERVVCVRLVRVVLRVPRFNLKISPQSDFQL